MTRAAKYLGVVQQRPMMSRSELRQAIDEILASGIDEGADGEPNMSQLRKASRQLDLIMQAVERYIIHNA